MPEVVDRRSYGGFYRRLSFRKDRQREGQWFAIKRTKVGDRIITTKFVVAGALFPGKMGPKDDSRLWRCQEGETVFKSSDGNFIVKKVIPIEECGFSANGTIQLLPTRLTVTFVSGGRTDRPQIKARMELPVKGHDGTLVCVPDDRADMSPQPGESWIVEPCFVIDHQDDLSYVLVAVTPIRKRGLEKTPPKKGKHRVHSKERRDGRLPGRPRDRKRGKKGNQKGGGRKSKAA